MFDRNRIDATIHYAMSFVGGYFGIYALMVRSNNFGSSQTSNLIYIVSSLLGNDLKSVIIRIGAALLYMFAVFLTVYLPRHFNINLKITSILIDAVAVIILAFLPLEMDPILGLYPIFFAMAFQWNSFTGARGYVSATIFSTNNLRQITISLTEYLMGNKSRLDKFCFYGATLLSFQVGVAVSFVLWRNFSIGSIWFCLIPLVCSMALVLREVYVSNISSKTYKNLI
ncbi:MAG: YoaK family protein [Lachnospirales bacterium]